MARPLSEDARAKMIAAGRQIIGERGVDGFTVDEVARRSGVAKTTIYRHFASGDELILASVDSLIEPIPVPDTGSFRSDLREISRAFIEIGSRHDIHQLFTSVMGRAARDPEFAELRRALVCERHDPLRAVIEAAVERGEVDHSIDVETAMALAEGPFVVRLVVDHTIIDDDEVESFVDLIARALAPRSDAYS